VMEVVSADSQEDQDVSEYTFFLDSCLVFFYSPLFHPCHLI
jgi:hypothetical protein